MRTEISKMHHRLQTTFIYVTHDQIEAMTLGTRIVVLKDGVIQQVDTPANLYGKPQNLFVAGFIGSPQMNMIEAKVVKKGDDVVLQFGKVEVVLIKEKADKVVAGGYIGKKVIMGIRPEHISDPSTLFEEQKPDFVTADAVVEVVEMLGAEKNFFMVCESNNITGRFDTSCAAGPDDHVQVAIDITKVHVFDPESQQTITN